jgi:hypothetical protein
MNPSFLFRHVLRQQMKLQKPATMRVKPFPLAVTGMLWTAGRGAEIPSVRRESGRWRNGPMSAMD